MVLGTSSGAGKSLMTAALCRVLHRRGETPLPFKGQNMSNNAWVDQSGGEMAYSQALQAWAAKIEPHHSMNPVLLKPQGDSTSELIHLGKTVGHARAEHYYRDWFKSGWAAIRTGLNQLQSAHPGGRLVLEGAGSPVEVNLQARDLTNLRLAQYLKARCILVADIERGGVFAQLMGTLLLLRPIERPLIRGLLINRFRGRRELFDQGRHWLEQNSGIPVLGIMPWLNELFPPEDSLDLLERRGRKTNADIEIAVLKLRSLSNFSDLDPLEAEPTIQLRWITPNQAIGNPAAVILPGSKQTLKDLDELQKTDFPLELQNYLNRGGQVFGICGGMQMLGNYLNDPNDLEGSSKGGKNIRGLNLIPLCTEYTIRKELKQVNSISLWPKEGYQLEGFELHRGNTKPIGIDATKVFPFAINSDLGHWHPYGINGGVVAGTYLHGIFENGPWRRAWLNRLRAGVGLELLSEQQPHHRKHRDALLDRLADAFEAHVNLDPLLGN
jgi:adenosylcobyric acid synthase